MRDGFQFGFGAFAACCGGALCVASFYAMNTLPHAEIMVATLSERAIAASGVFVVGLIAKTIGYIFMLNGGR